MLQFSTRNVKENAIEKIVTMLGRDLANPAALHPTAEHKKLAMQRYEKACTNLCTNSDSENGRHWPNVVEIPGMKEPV